MPAKRFGKYRSRRKKKEKGGGVIGDVGRGMKAVGSFVGGTGKTIADVAAKAAPILGNAVEASGKLLESKELQDVGKWTAGVGRDIAKGAADAAPIAGDITQKVGSWLDQMDPEEQEEQEEHTLGGSLYDSFKFDHGKHAARALSQMGRYQHRGIQAAARHLAGVARRAGDHPILAHRTITNAAKKHFHTIMNLGQDQLAQTLHRSRGALHKAVTDTIHSAHMGGGIEFGGGLWEDVGTGLKIGGSASKIMGGAAAGMGVVMSVAGAPEFGAPLVAAGGAAYAMGAGAEALGSLAGSRYKTPKVSGSMFTL